MSGLEIIDPAAGGCGVAAQPRDEAPVGREFSADDRTYRRTRLPRWLKRRVPLGTGISFTDRTVEDLGLETVCREAQCPNRSECWSRKTATFMVMGKVCTRPCGFCAVKRGRPDPLDADEPQRLAEACRRLGLRYIVLTSVDRDDLPDGGAEHFRQCIEAVRRATGAKIEVLTPDFQGDADALDCLMDARPEVFNHNVETVARLQRPVRRRANYRDSLFCLDHVKRRYPGTATKSGIMLGLGETFDEILATAADLRRIGVDLLTVGQYLQPSQWHLPVERFWTPDEFAHLGRLCRRMGFAHVASAPFVRSSYHADEAWQLASDAMADA